MKGDKKRKVTIEYYICPGCELRFPIPRRRRREEGHIKDLWCPNCKTEQKFVKEERWRSQPPWKDATDTAETSE